jgi:hypothetical protein
LFYQRSAYAVYSTFSVPSAFDFIGEGFRRIL